LDEFLVEEFAETWDANDDKHLKDSPFDWEDGGGKALFNVRRLEEDGNTNVGSFVSKTNAEEYSLDRRPGSQTFLVNARKLYKHFNGLANATREMSGRMRMANMGKTITDPQAFLLDVLLEADKRYVAAFMNIKNQQQCVLYALPMFDGPPTLVMDLTPRDWKGEYTSNLRSMRVYLKENCTEQ
jgi:hypothetical protein